MDGFGTLNVYEVSWVEQNLREIKSGFEKDYERNIHNAKFFKKVNKQVKTEANDDVNGGVRVGRRSRAHLCAMVLTMVLLYKTFGFTVMKFLTQILPPCFDHGFSGFFFWDRLNVHTFNCHHRADKRMGGWRIHRGFIAEADSWRIHCGFKANGFAKVVDGFGHERWTEGGSIGVVTYEAKKKGGKFASQFTSSEKHLFIYL